MAFLKKIAFAVTAFTLITSLTVSLIISQKLTELVEWFIVLATSFISGNLISYYIKKFLDKELDFDDLYYLKKAVIIVGREVIFWLVIPFFIFLIPALQFAYASDEYIISKAPKLLEEHPFCWIFFCGILIFSYRIKYIKIHLIKLQNEYRKTINE